MADNLTILEALNKTVLATKKYVDDTVPSIDGDVLNSNLISMFGIIPEDGVDNIVGVDEDILNSNLTNLFGFVTVN